MEQIRIKQSKHPPTIVKPVPCNRLEFVLSFIICNCDRKRQKDTDQRSVVPSGN